MNWILSNIQELLATSLLVLVFTGTLFGACYIWILTRFFNELHKKEPDAWEKIGSPALVNMLVLPFINVQKFYAFYSVLKAHRKDNYRYAGKAYCMLWLGLAYCLLLFVMALLLAVGIVFQHLIH